MLVVKKRPLTVDVLYFDYSMRLAAGETLVSCSAAPTMELPSSDNTDLTFGTLSVNSGGPLTPPPPAAMIPTSKGASMVCAGGVIPDDVTSPSSWLPDGSVGTLYQFSFSATTSLVTDTVSRVIDESYQLWVSNTDYPPFWTSKYELGRRYGTLAVSRWADLNGNGTQAEIDANIWAAVAEATDDARSLLRGAPCGVITPTKAQQSYVLRLNVTRYAAYILYTGKGVKDANQEDGTNRLGAAKSDYMKFIRQVQAGTRRLFDVSGLNQAPVAVCVDNQGLLGAHLQQERNLMGQTLDFQFPAFDAWFDYTETL